MITGIELDRAIAEMRGEKSCMHYSGFPLGVSEDSEGCTNDSIAWPDCENCLMFSHKPYSSSIVHAMELMNEMILEWDFVDISSCQRGHVVNLVRNLENFHNTHGRTMAEAISGAWYKWKQEGKV